MLIDREDLERRNRAYSARMRRANLKFPTACFEEIDYQNPRGFDKGQILSFASCDWVERHQNIIFTGPSGIGKDYLACAISQRACMMGYSATYLRVPRLEEIIRSARAEGSFEPLLNSIAKHDILILDDFGLAPMTDELRRDFMEIIDDRYNKRSTIITAQLPVEKWHEMIGNPTIADAIMDRLVHNAHRIALKGPSERKRRSVLVEKSTIN